MTQRTTRAGLSGLIAAALALGIGELVAGLVGGVPSPVASVGAQVVDRSPPFMKDFAIAVFGTGDKAALAIGTIVIALIVGWLIGLAALRRPWVPIAVFAAFALFGAIAGFGEVGAEWPLVAATMLVAAGAGVGALFLLIGAAGEEQPTDGLATDPTRRRFFALAAAGGAAAVVAGGVGRYLVSRIPEAPIETLAVPEGTLAAPTAAQSFTVPGLTPVVVPNDRFYRIDTALVVPRIDPATWSMKITGMVDREVEFTYDDITAMDLVEDYAMLCCVSNEVGGTLVGNARWTGVRLTELLDRAGVQAGATQLVGRSVDDWTAGFPTELAFDGREPMLAIGMNGEPLPLAHGFPARLVVPGLYGYVSATKWLSEIELTTWDGFDAYWVPRGWSKEGPIKIQSRIDVPRSRETVVPGQTTFAGVAWAPLEGIDMVEIRVDEGEWIPAEVAEALSSKAWVQWRGTADLTAGRHVIEVRATDGSGRIQPADRQPPRPDGATGYHSVAVTAA